MTSFPVAEEYFLRDPQFLDSIGPDYMSHEDRYANELRKACHMIHKFSENEEINQVIGRPDGVRYVCCQSVDNKCKLSIAVFCLVLRKKVKH